MSGRWFRLYDELVDDPKVQRLSGDTFKGLINLWCLASRNDGFLPQIEDIAFSLRLPAVKIARLLADLRVAGLVDDDEDGSGVTRPHNWNGRQFRSDVSNERVKRHRERQRNGDGNVTPTVTATPPEQSRDRTEQTRSSSEARARLLTEFETVFWPAYPHRVDRPDALKAFIAARMGTRVRGKPPRPPSTLDQIMAGLDRYQRDKPSERQWLNPATFLNQERFNDEPAAAVQRSRNGLDALGSALAAVADQIHENEETDREVKRISSPH